MVPGAHDDTLRRLPPELHERARAVASGGAEVAQPRHAATVVLLRDGDAGVEAYLLRRLGSMAFAGGMYVFPGGSVDPRDGDADIAWQGPPPGEWAAPLSADERLARGLVAAAVRETFEESGVLLASPVTGDAEHWAREQAALLDRTASMADVLARNALVLRADLLRPWAHWVTPEIEPKRFDTRFFVAALPEGQTAVHYRGESDHSEWMTPRAAVERHAAGELGMMPPTVFTLAELSAYDTVADVLEAGWRRDIKRVLPRIVVDADDVLLLLPGDPRYPDD